MRAHVMVAEDDADQAELVRRYVEHEGHEVTLVHDGRTALDLLRGRCPDLLVLDVMMPRVDGLDVCRVVRADPRLAHLPVLMLTARSSEDDLLLGLDLGADDYMTKPFSPRELMARIRSLLRRSERVPDAEAAREARGPVLRAGPVSVDRARHEAWAYGRAIHCTPGEFRLLDMLAEHAGQVLSRAQILERLHGSDPFITPRTVDVHVMNLRRKIKDVRSGPGDGTPLVTVYGVGYKLADTPHDPQAHPHG
ncbi:response regulator transcription factor [Streptomyces mayonensis]|uniref:response regulator transcription factor n=1 Tax=Streptomyces mayonensis TaxID=2750816 RepID=UPI001C1E7A92|nr:response regulator transcription factor [Streptomyces sp. A108]MBU6531025.1 response regulator transcription factor [Streptomyces sp. A108]